MGRHDTTAGAFYDTSDAVAADICDRTSGRHLLVLTDFDGTLSELASTPAGAILEPDVRTAIESLAALDAVTFGVISGRRLADVAARVGPAAMFAAGLHGLEIEGAGARFRHAALDPVAPAIAALRAEAADRLAWCPGVLLEDKTFALTCHVRLAPEDLAPRALQQFEDAARPRIDAGLLRLLSGSCALEALPAVDWHKGRAAVWIRDHLAARIPRPIVIIYLGDDRTDEDAFDALGDDDVVVGVGERPHTHLIDHRLAGPASVGRLFSKIASTLKGTRQLH